jgi:hypothetical protein
MDAYADMPGDHHRQYGRRMIILMEWLRTHHAAAPDLLLLASAIDLRILALQRLFEETTLPGCDWPPGHPMPTLPPGAFGIASNEPMRRSKDGLACFDADRFRQRLVS